MPYGTIDVGQMYVQYLDPAQLRHPLPVVLVHGGGGQMRALHGARRHVGLGALLRAGRLQGVSRRSAGTRPVAVSSRRARRDRPGGDLRPAHARHGDVRARRRTSSGPGRPATSAIRWSISSWRRPTRRRANGQLAQELWRTHGAELVDRIGPCIVHDALGRRSVRVARRQRAAEPGEGAGVVRGRHRAAGRAGRTAGHAAAEPEEHPDDVPAGRERRPPRASRSSTR